jgi:hypothetical protein
MNWVTIGEGSMDWNTPMKLANTVPPVMKKIGKDVRSIAANAPSTDRRFRLISKPENILLEGRELIKV